MVSAGATYRALAIFLALTAIGACNAPGPPPENDAAAAENDVADALENAADAVDANMTAAVAPLAISWSEDYSGPLLTVRNSGQETLTLQKVIVNNQEGDSDCNIKVFKLIGAGTSLQVSAPRCGAITMVRAITDHGEAVVTLDTFQQSIRLRFGNMEGYRSVSIYNDGPKPWMVNRVVLNGQDSDSDCNIKVFRQVPTQGSIDVSANSCGQINSAKVITDAGEASFSLINQPVNATANSM
ncbi:MAG TPA: hypothetical protein VIT45_13920 [Allosphingosinicella sp.]